jgi:hypothetical protein
MLFDFLKKKEAAPAPKGGKGKVQKVVVPDFAYGLVGSDVEAGNFDPLELSAGRSEETVNWYRSAELKVVFFIFCGADFVNFGYLLTLFLSFKITLSLSV